jgi:hypothetical protein
MASRVVLHIGAMKSGTTYLQHRLRENTDVLAEQDVLFPRVGDQSQTPAVQDVLRRIPDGVSPEARAGRWAALCEAVHTWNGTAVISAELLAVARPPGVHTVVDSFAPAEVEVVLTARDLARNIPAMWQETVQNGRTWTWHEYVDGVRNGDRKVRGPARSFWNQQDLPRILRRWTQAVPPTRTTLITLPRPGGDPELLWERFCAATGIEAGPCGPGSQSNASLGAPSAELMRRLNAALDEIGLPWPQYGRVVKHHLAKQVLAARRRQESPIAFDEPWVRPMTQLRIGRLKAIGSTSWATSRSYDPRRCRVSTPMTCHWRNSSTRRSRAWLP